MIKVVLLSLAMLTPVANATTVLSCSFMGAVTECAERAVDHCGKTDSDCLATYGFVPQYHSTVNNTKVWCGLSTTESTAIVYGNCSGARG